MDLDRGMVLPPRLGSVSRRLLRFLVGLFLGDPFNKRVKNMSRIDYLPILTFPSRFHGSHPTFGKSLRD